MFVSPARDENKDKGKHQIVSEIFNDILDRVFTNLNGKKKLSLLQIYPLPKANPKNKSNSTKRGKYAIRTSTPEKDKVEEAQNKMQNQLRKPGLKKRRSK